MNKKGTERKKERFSAMRAEQRDDVNQMTGAVLKKNSQQPSANVSSTGCLLRIFWMLVGNVVLTFCILGIVQHHDSMLSFADVCYWVIVGSLLAARYFDIRHFGGTTTDGEPATLVHWRRYAMVLGMVSMVLWIGAHVVAYYGA